MWPSFEKDVTYVQAKDGDCPARPGRRTEVTRAKANTVRWAPFAFVA